MTDSEIKKPWDAWDFDYQDEYSFWADVVYNIPKVNHAIWPKINQWMNTKSKSACTIFWAWAQLIRLFWLDLTREKANEIWLLIVDYCVKNWWYKVWEWWGTPTAVKYVIKRWNEVWYNEFKKEKVFYLRLLWNNPIVKEALDKWHMVWYSKTIQWAWDQIKGYVDKAAEEYKQMLWHRLNLKWPDYIPVATWWATKWDAKWWSQDNYFEQIWTNFYIEDLGRYINKGVYSYVYVILPESSMWNNSAEEEKKRIEEEKAVNALIWSLTTVRWSLPEKFQKKISALASELRSEYPNARKLVSDEKTKHYQSVCDQLSFNWKRADGKYQEEYANIAKQLRNEYNLE